VPISQGAKGGARGGAGFASPALGVSSVEGVGRCGAHGGAPGTSGTGDQGVGSTGGSNKARPFRSQPFDNRCYPISGVTKDSTGAPLAGVTVDLFDTRTDVKLDSEVSDGSGAYVFNVTSGPFYIVAYKAGEPDVAGTTVNTLGPPA
jgi:hypothetical protein